MQIQDVINVKSLLHLFNYKDEVIKKKVSIEFSIEYVCLRMHGMLITTKILLDN